MKHGIALLLLSVSLAMTVAACNPSEAVPSPSTSTGSVGSPSEEDSDTPGTPDPNIPDTPENPGTMNRNLTITIGTASFAAQLEDNATARAFAAMLPLEVRMNELNGNEKYTYLSSSLPTASSAPGTIETGDLMLWGSDCLVLFYETFSTSYSYTRIGRLVDPSGLAAAVGSGSVTVRFEPASRQD